MRFSILIANHNYGLYLSDAIQSALAQRHPATEVIVVDDGSTDKSSAIAQSYGSQIKFIQQANLGHVEAANAAFAASNGDAVIFLDADDLLYPDCVPRALANWKAGISKIQYRLDTINENGVDQEMSFPHYPADMTPSDVLHWSLRNGWYPWPVSSGNVYSRAYLDQVFPIPSARIYKSPDGYLNRLAPLYGEVITLRETLGAYRVHGHNRWAMADAEQIARVSTEWVDFDKILQSEFERRAHIIGLRAARYEQLRSVQRDEYRLLAKRFAALAQRPVESRVRLLAAGLSSAFRAPQLSLVGRVAWSGWFLALALFSRRLVAKLFVKSRAQVGRSTLSRLIVSISRHAMYQVLLFTSSLWQLSLLST